MRRTTALPIFLGALGLALLAIAENVAADKLPAAWEPYLWIAWPVVGLGAVATTVIGLRATRRTSNEARVVPAAVRDALISRVREYWVDGVLHASLWNAARIRLGMNVQENAPHPWGLRTAGPGAEPRTVAPSTSIVEVFDESDKLLLILGEPGGGKTTMLLELAEQLLGRAGAAAQPVPVVFPLASWASAQPLDEWMADELSARYDIPPRWSRTLVMGEQLIPLLDGLDEVDPDDRAQCAKAINAYRAEHGATRVVVCCRADDYRRLDAKVDSYATVTIQPLRPDQVERFLVDAGEAARGVRVALTAEPALWELLESPLLLSVFVLTYADSRVEPGDLAAGRRDRLYSAYVHRQLRGGQPDGREPGQSIRRLAFLASMGEVVDLELVPTAFRSWTQGGWWSTPNGLALTVCMLVGSGALGGVAGALLGWGGAVGGCLLGGAIGTCGAPAQPRDEFGWRFVGIILIGLIAPQILFWGNSPECHDIVWVGPSFTYPPSTTGPAMPTFTPGHYACNSWVGLFYLVPWIIVAYVTALVIFLARVGGAAKSSRPRWKMPGPTACAAARSGLRTAALAGVLAPILPAVVVALTVSGEVGIRFAGVVAVAAVLGPICFGGYALVEQVIAYWILRKHGLLPTPLRPFLDYATSCLLLRRIGEDYVFVHRELQLHFRHVWLETRGEEVRSLRRANDFR